MAESQCDSDGLPQEGRPVAPPRRKNKRNTKMGRLDRNFPPVEDSDCRITNNEQHRYEHLRYTHGTGSNQREGSPPRPVLKTASSTETVGHEISPQSATVDSESFYQIPTNLKEWAPPLPPFRKPGANCMSGELTPPRLPPRQSVKDTRSALPDSEAVTQSAYHSIPDMGGELASQDLTTRGPVQAALTETVTESFYHDIPSKMFPGGESVNHDISNMYPVKLAPPIPSSKKPIEDPEMSPEIATVTESVYHDIPSDMFAGEQSINHDISSSMFPMRSTNTPVKKTHPSPQSAQVPDSVYNMIWGMCSGEPTIPVPSNTKSVPAPQTSTEADTDTESVYQDIPANTFPKQVTPPRPSPRNSLQPVLTLPRPKSLRQVPLTMYPKNDASRDTESPPPLPPRQDRVNQDDSIYNMPTETDSDGPTPSQAVPQGQTLYPELDSMASRGPLDKETKPLGASAAGKPASSPRGSQGLGKRLMSTFYPGKRAQNSTRFSLLDETDVDQDIESDLNLPAGKVIKGGTAKVPLASSPFVQGKALSEKQESKQSARAGIRRAKALLGKLSLPPIGGIKKGKRGDRDDGSGGLEPTARTRDDVADLGGDCGECKQWQFFHDLWKCDSDHLLCVECFHRLQARNEVGGVRCPEAMCGGALKRHKALGELGIDVPDRQGNDKSSAAGLGPDVMEGEDDCVRCGYCYSRLVADMMQCEDGHLFCCECIRASAHIILSGESRPPMACMVDDCQATFPMSQIERALTEEEFRAYSQIHGQKEEHKAADLGHSPQVFHCPGCGSAAHPNETYFYHCPKCGKTCCSSCFADCTIHKQLPSASDQNEEKELRLSFEELMTKATIRKCHQCQSAFTKEGHCNFITCLCHATMCYICRKADIEQDHFCQHPHDPGVGCKKCSKCHLYTNPEEDEKSLIAKLNKAANHERQQRGLREVQIGAPGDM